MPDKNYQLPEERFVSEHPEIRKFHSELRPNDSASPKERYRTLSVRYSISPSELGSVAEMYY